MSSGALFGTNARSANKNLVEFKAGKMTMKGKMVYPDNRKGQLYVYQSEDSLMHFCWRDRTSGVVEDDLIIFPDDCEFKHVSQCKTGRVYLLKFKSSSRKFFFWLQDIKTDKDEEHCRKINELLNNPPTPGSQRSGGGNPEGDLQNLLNNMSQQQLMQLFGGVGQIGGLGSLLGTMNRPFSGNRISTTSSLTPVTATTRLPTSVALSSTNALTEVPKTSGNNKSQPTETVNASLPEATDNRIRLTDLQNFLSEIPSPSTIDSAFQRCIANELSLIIPMAISTSESLDDIMNKHLPIGDSLSTTLSSPQFSQALSMFWSALHSGQVAPIIQQFALGKEAVKAAASGNLEQFINALEIEARTTDGVLLLDQKIEENSVELSEPKRQYDEKPRKDDDGDNNEDDEGMALD